MAAKIIKAEEAVARSLKVVSPVLSSYFTEEAVVQMLKEGEKLALIIKKKEDEMMLKAQEHVEAKRIQLEDELEVTKQRGYNEGYEAGKKEFLLKVQGLSSELEQIKHKAGLEAENLFQKVEEQIVRLSLAIAEKITKTSFQQKPDVFVDFIKRLFDQVRVKDSVTIKVNPKQFEKISKYKEEFSEYLGIDDFGIQKDSNIDEYGVGISMDTGFMDASMKSIFSQIEKKLLNE